MVSTYNRVVTHVVRLPPSAHHIGIVEGQHGDYVDAFFLQFWEIPDVTGQVVHGAGGCEGACKKKSVRTVLYIWSARLLTRHGKQHHLLVRPLLRGVVVDRNAARGDVAFFLRVGDVPVRSASTIFVYNSTPYVCGCILTGTRHRWESCRQA